MVAHGTPSTPPPQSRAHGAGRSMRHTIRRRFGVCRHLKMVPADCALDTLMGSSPMVPTAWTRAATMGRPLTFARWSRPLMTPFVFFIYYRGIEVYLCSRGNADGCPCCGRLPPAGGGGRAGGCQGLAQADFLAAPAPPAGGLAVEARRGQRAGVRESGQIKTHRPSVPRAPRICGPPTSSSLDAFTWRALSRPRSL